MKAWPERPVLSINREFSAPVKLTANLSADDLRRLAAHDSDAFNRWQAVQTLATRLLLKNVALMRAGKPAETDDGLIGGTRRDPGRRRLEPAFVSLSLVDADRSRHRARDRPRRRSGKPISPPARSCDP